MSAEPEWIGTEPVLRIHDDAIGRYGGSAGVRDPGLLESALARPRNMFAYGETDIFQLAAGYALGIARNHPFVDGNKRTAYFVAVLFLDLNDLQLQIEDDERQADYFVEVATGQVSQDELAEFYRENTVPKGR